MTNTTPTTYSDLVTLCARSAIEQGADDSYVCQSGDFEALADFAGSEPDATTRDELARDVRAAIRERLASIAAWELPMATTPRQTCWIVRHPGPHGAASYDRTTECATLREARRVAEKLDGAAVHRGYGPAGDRGIGDAVR